MNLFPPRGRARRASGPVRRRTGRFAPPMVVEPLEGRRLLAAGNLGVDVVISPFASFVNLMQTPGNWAAAPGVTNPLAYNASGDPESDAAFVVDLRVNQPWNGPDPAATPLNLSGTYNLSFNGQAIIQPEYQGFSTPFTVQNQSYNASTNTTTAQLVVPTSNYSDFFGVSFLNTQATATSPINTGFSNARLIRPGYAANSTQLYSNEFLAALKPYNTLRYLYPDNVNGQPFYSGNTLVTVNASQVDQTGMPWEYEVALANASQTDMWINVPQGATTDYITALARIIQDGGTVNGVSYPGLASNLKVYVEYSNEVWGGIGPNEYYQEAAVQNTATNQPLTTFSGNLDVYNNADGTTTTNVSTALGRRYLEETADIGQIFQSVMGSDPTHQRVRPVLGWQEGYASFFPAALDWYEHFFGSANAAFYGIGDADYLPEPNATSEPALLSALSSEVAAYGTTDPTQFTAVATYYELANVSYEGGPSIGANGSNVTSSIALAAARDPAMEQLIVREYEAIFAAGGTIASYNYGPYDILSPSNPSAVSELSQYGNPSASPKFRGLTDLANAAPTTVTAGVAVPASGVTNFSASTDALGDNLVQPDSGSRGYWLLNVASGGTYDLKLTTNAVSGTSPGQVEVFVDDKQVGGIINVSALSLVDLGNLPLSTGLNTLSIVFLHASNDPNGGSYGFQPTTLTLSTPGTILVGDSGFEGVSVGNGNVQYNPGGSLWTFSGSAGNGSGIAGNNSAMTSGNPPASEGSQVAFLEGVSTITQSIAGWAAGTYAISFDAAQRGNFGGAQTFEVVVDTNVVGAFQPSGTGYQSYTTNAFTVSAGTHVVEILGLGGAGGDNTDLLDAFAVSTASGSGSGSGSDAVPAVGDFSFEQASVGAGNFVTDPSGSAWSFAGSAGIAGYYSGFTAGNGPAPQGAQVAFIQGTGSITQVMSGWGGGSYTIAFEAAQRGSQPSSAEDFEVLVDGVVVGKFKPSGASYQAYTTASFTASAGAHLVRFLGLDSVGGDNTALLDAITITGTGSGSGSGSGSAPMVGDSGFEAVPAAAGGYLYDPSGSAWTFSGSPGSGSGVTANGSPFTSGNPAAPQGSQVAFLQNNGTITQSVASWGAGTYAISFDAAHRGNYGGVEDFEVLVDGNVVGTFRPTTTSYQSYTTGSFTVSAGSHVIEFLGLNTAGGDNTAFLDAVAVATTTTPPTPAVGDSGFEAVPVGAGNFQYDPAGSAWAFAGSAGVSGANSGFSAGNGPAPQGSQVAFLQQVGSITQSVSSWAAGTYTIAFEAAQRGDQPSSAEDFEVLVDGVVVGKFKPSGQSYQAYATSSFTVSAGSHVVEFLGLDSVGGDNTAMLDNVTIA